jgi:multidrug efflux pump subunit AcrB
LSITEINPPLAALGYLFASVQLPEAASLERTEAVMAQARKLLMANPVMIVASGSDSSWRWISAITASSGGR